MTREAIEKLIQAAGLPRYDKSQVAATPQELSRLVEAAVREEREACASVADQFSAPLVASTIRKRGQA